MIAHLLALACFASSLPLSETEAMMSRVGTPNRELAFTIEEIAFNRKEKSLLVAIARFEAGPRFAQDAIGDSGHSVGPFQRYDGPTSFLWNAHASAVEALRQLRESWTVCGSLPVEDRLSVYARGRVSDRGRELSRSRVRLARKLGGW